MALTITCSVLVTALAFAPAILADETGYKAWLALYVIHIPVMAYLLGGAG